MEAIPNRLRSSQLSWQLDPNRPSALARDVAESAPVDTPVVEGGAESSGVSPKGTEPHKAPVRSLRRAKEAPSSGMPGEEEGHAGVSSVRDP